MPKDIIFSKIKKRDFNKELETVLDKKQFPEDVKNLLLSMLYKIGMAYDDYSKIKLDVLNKNEYIENLIQKIMEECETIKIIKTGSEKYKKFIEKGINYKVDKKNKSIEVYQDEKKILQAIFELSESSNIVAEKYNIVKDATEEFLLTASIIDEGEVIRDFNGWSWSTLENEIKDIDYNLIYQNLLILVGRQFLKSWTNGSNYIVDYVEELKIKMNNVYGKNLTNKYLDLLYKILVEKYIVENNKKRKIENRIKELNDNLEEYKNSIEFLEKLSKEKKELLKEIEKIDFIVSTERTLEKEYKIEYPEEEIPINIFSDRLRSDRAKKIKRIKELSILMDPKMFNRKRETEKKEIEFLENLNIDRNIIKKEILKLQNIFIECIKYRIKNIKTKNEIINIIKLIRYYNFVIYEEKQYIKDKKEIKLLDLEKNIIDLAIKMKVLNNNLEYELLENIFRIRSTDLENLVVRVKKEDGLIAEYIDGETIEEKIKIKENERIKLNRRIKIFL